VRLRIVIFGLLIFIATFTLLSHFLLVSRVRSIDFKAFAQTKVGEFFNAKAHVAKIRVGFLNQVTLTGIDLHYEGEQNRTTSHVRIHQMIFRYPLIRLLTQDLRNPTSVILNAPEISFRNETFPYAFFENLNFGRKTGTVSHLKLVGGSVRFEIPGIGSKLQIKEMEGFLRPAGRGKILVDFDAALGESMEGAVHLRGEIDPLHKTHRFLLDLNAVQWNARDFALPLEGISGKMRWENSNLYFDTLSAGFHGWKVFLRGRLEHFNLHPLLVLNWKLGEGKIRTEGALKADLVRGRLQGAVRRGEEQRFLFHGGIRQEGLRFLFDRLRIQGGYRGHGRLDFKTGDYHFEFEKDIQRLAATSNLKGLDFQLHVNLNHMNFFGMDLVTDATVRLIPVISQWEKRLWKFNAVFKTGYFILEYAPFHDFQGSFELTARGIKNLSGSWGEVFHLDGIILLRNPSPEAMLTLKVDGFDLKEVHEFAGKPLPKKLGGILEGKLKIEGPLRKPEVSGNFVIKSGELGKLQYDRGIFQFRGFPPYLKLYDSHILKGRTTLLLTGALDLSLSNMFHAVRIETLDRFIIWKGWELSVSPGEGDIEIQPAFSKFPVLALTTGSEDTAALGSETEKQEEEKYLLVGPRLRF
jgi:hypothetical protein